MTQREQTVGTEESDGAGAPVPPPLDPLAWLLYPVFLAAFLGTLVIFEIVQRIAIRRGSAAQQKAALELSVWLRACLFILGTKIEVEEPEPGYLASLPADRPFVVVSSHQSMFDICILACLFGRHFPRFVSKQELARGIPAVSYNLRVGGAALIDRENPRQAIPEIKRFAAHLEKTRFVGVIFPEGTRSRTGALKELQAAGLTVLLANAETAEVIPVALCGTWKLSARKLGPVPRNVRIGISVLPARPRSPNDAKVLTKEVLQALSSEFAKVHHRYG